MRLLILGASGDQGAAQVQAALAAGHSVKAACRRPPSLEHATSMEALEWVSVDYSQPTTLAPAMQGVNVVLANFPSSSFNDGPTLVRAAIATGVAARAAGVSLIVFNTSLPVMEAPRGFAAHDVRLQMREALEASGVPVISLQPSWTTCCGVGHSHISPTATASFTRTARTSRFAGFVRMTLPH